MAWQPPQRMQGKWAREQKAKSGHLGSYSLPQHAVSGLTNARILGKLKVFREGRLVIISYIYFQNRA
jgi:hypothetical protein